MSAAFIIDCSLAMSWLFEDEATDATNELLDRLQDEAALVPALWFFEVSNVLAFAERKGRISQAQSKQFIADLCSLDIEVDALSHERAFPHIFPLSRKHQLTSYDAVYLDLALSRQLPLGTLDEPLRKAAKKAGVKLLGK